VVRHRLGPDVANGEAPHVLVPPAHWQAARPLGHEPVLVSCVVVPGFDFADFELHGPA
jgi:predicted cupin superfamily sugar epimerase